MPTRAERGAELPYRGESELASRSRDLHRMHDAFVSAGSSADDAKPSGRALRPLVLDSWRRCLRGGVDPESTPARMELADDALARARAAHPLFAAMPIIRRLLVESATEAGMLVAVSDAAGRLLWVEGSHRLRSRAEGITFLPGANWSETSAGTNAPGTALALDAPVQIFGAEHLSRPVTPWSCSAAPVHDPITGAILGVLDLTGGPVVAGPQALALVRATVAAVEAELRLAQLTHELRHDPPARLSRRTDVGDPHGSSRTSALQVLGRRRARLRLGDGADTDVELSLRHSEILILLAQARDGLSADELALGLSEQDISTVTVRAELSRLRTTLASVPLGSRPYRLLRTVRSDLDDVRDELRAGRLRSAVARYPGPVLPRSEAPGVMELREEVHHELRRALLRRGDPDALLGFADTDHGRQDLQIWTAALASLPPGSPRYPQVISHCEDLRAELA